MYTKIFVGFVTNMRYDTLHLFDNEPVLIVFEDNQQLLTQCKKQKMEPNI